MAAYIGMTGTPGTGKKTLAPTVASRLGIPCHSLNDPAYITTVARRRGGETEVDPLALGKRVSAMTEGPCLLYGHLLPYAFGPGAFSKVVVLRCDPAVLRARLAKRRYGEGKIAENVEAELIGIISSDAVAAFGRDRVTEVDTSRGSVSAVTARIVKRLNSRGELESIDWVRTYGSAAKLRSLLGPRTFSA